jgi:hypothetical protein
MVEPRIVWIASYPKSGNTWARFLLSNMLFDKVRGSADIEAMVPDVHRGREVNTRYHIGGTIFLKTHWALADEMPELARTAAAVYIVRHPLDVLRSHIDYAGVAGDADKRAAFVDAYIAAGGAPAWLRRRFGSWLENVAAWTGARGRFPLLVLRYEDLKADPAAGVRAVAAFFKCDLSEADVARIVDASSFERMRALEEAELAAGTEGFFGNERGNASDPDFRFMRAGTVGGWRELLTDAQLAAARERFGAAAETLGYSLD